MENLPYFPPSDPQTERSVIDSFDPAVLNDLEYILKDLIAGDPSAQERPEYQGLDLRQVRAALNYILENQSLNDREKNELLTNSWRVNYRDRPPTPEEFLTEKYLGPVAGTIYPQVRKVFLEYLDPVKPYRTCVLYPYIGWGKSYLAVLVNLYIGVHLSLMKAPWKFFGGSPATVYTQVFCAESLKKSSELLFEPLLNMLESSTFFEKVHSHEAMVNKDREFARMTNIDKIYWTTATPSSELQFSNGTNFKLISKPGGLLGQAQPLDEPIKKPDGTWTTMGELKLGEKIASPSEGETEVIALLPQGKIACYEIELVDGRKTRCSLHHKWKVRYYTQLGEEVDTEVDLAFMLKHPEYEFYIYDEADCQAA